MTGKVSYSINGVADKKDCVDVTGQQNNSVIEMAGKKDCLFVTSKKEAVNVLPVNSCPVVTHVHFANRYPQKKGVNLDSGYCQEIKYMNDVSRVGHLSSLKCVTNVPTVAPDLPVGARLHQVLEKWAALGVSPKVVTVLREDYILPFQFRPNLTRSPTIISCYVNLHRNLYLMEALHQLLNKNAVEPITTPKSLGFYNRVFLVPKSNNQWRPTLDLSILNTFLKTESFKMETPETIRTSLQAEEWVTSIDFRDTYFHILIQSRSRKYMRFHVHTCTAKGFKDSPVPRRPVGQSQIPPNFFQHTQTLVALCQELS